MSWQKHFQKFQTIYMLLGFALFLMLNAITLATSKIMESVATGEDKPSFATWEPFVWEFSSAIGIVVLIPFIVWLLQSKWLSWSSPLRSAVILLSASILFSMLHIFIMIVIREGCYFAFGSNYHFGNIWFGFLYEYRKDLITFVLLIVAIRSYQFFCSRLRSEAELISEEENSDVAGETEPERILVKKLGKEFVVNLNNVEWYESSANYVNLHVNSRIYPVRSTMADMENKLKKLGFCRIHRSYGVNLDLVASIEPQENGTAELLLKTGKMLPVSKRYRLNLKQLAI